MKCRLICFYWSEKNDCGVLLNNNCGANVLTQKLRSRQILRSTNKA